MKYVSYLRVSTDKQGATGYGIEAQRLAIKNHLHDLPILAEYVEVESGKNDSRPELLKALAHCKKAKAVLVIAKLDRLSRKVSFVANLIDSGVEFVCCDNPHANKMTIQMLAVMAEFERDMISKRTKEGLASAKARGVVLGGYRGADMTNARIRAGEARRNAARSFTSSVYLNVKEAVQVGGNLSAAASILNSQGITTSRGCSWNPKAVSRIIGMMV